MNKQTYKMYLVLGDWSKDGHNQSEKVLVETNQPVENIQQAYKDSCRLTGISFNINEDYTGIVTKREDYPNYDQYRAAVERRRVACEYQDSSLNAYAFQQLEKHGLTRKMLGEWNNSTYDDNETEFSLSSESFTRLWMWFVKLSLPELEYTIPKDDIPVINGYWNKNLNAGFGYGLYY